MSKCKEFNYLRTLCRKKLPYSYQLIINEAERLLEICKNPDIVEKLDKIKTIGYKRIYIRNKRKRRQQKEKMKRVKAKLEEEETLPVTPMSQPVPAKKLPKPRSKPKFSYWHAGNNLHSSKEVLSTNNNLLDSSSQLEAVENQLKSSLKTDQKHSEPYPDPEGEQSEPSQERPQATEKQPESSRRQLQSKLLIRQTARRLRSAFDKAFKNKPEFATKYPTKDKDNFYLSKKAGQAARQLEINWYDGKKESPNSNFQKIGARVSNSVKDNHWNLNTRINSGSQIQQTQQQILRFKNWKKGLTWTQNLRNCRDKYQKIYPTLELSNSQFMNMIHETYQPETFTEQSSIMEQINKQNIPNSESKKLSKNSKVFLPDKDVKKLERDVLKALFDKEGIIEG